MDTATFNILVKDQSEKCENVLIKKAEEYARGDRLSNFKTSAAFLKCSPERALLGKWMKHLTSIRDIIMDIEDGGPPTSKELIEEKITDSMNYHHLLKGLIWERNGWANISNKG